MQLERSENVDFPRIVPRFAEIAENNHPTLVRCDYAGTCARAGYLFTPDEYFRFVDLCAVMSQEEAFDQAVYPVANLEPVFAGEVIAPLESPSPREFPFEAEAFDWWNQDEEDWDSYDSTGEFPEDAFDHLTEDEFEEYLFDRMLTAD